MAKNISARRRIAVRQSGDAWKQRNNRECPKLQIRLDGNWLIQAGFQPGHVEVSNPRPGELIIKQQEEFA
ncbi:MAG: hypothetical protein ACKOC5_10275 [Chloroflexota bacterium]